MVAGLVLLAQLRLVEEELLEDVGRDKRCLAVEEVVGFFLRLLLLY